MANKGILELTIEAILIGVLAPIAISFLANGTNQLSGTNATLFGLLSIFLIIVLVVKMGGTVVKM
jgi:hypothetical protein